MDFQFSEEQKAMIEVGKDFAQNEILPTQEQDEKEHRFRPEVLKKMAELGFFGCVIPEQYGGNETGHLCAALLTEEIARISASWTLPFNMQMWGPAFTILNYGTEEQKEKYLKPYLEGKLVAAEALTEPRGGSDFFGATTRAVLEGDRFIVNGQKRFVVGAEGADFFLVYCRTNLEPNADKYARISLLIIDKGQGVKTEYLYGLLGCRGGGTGRLVFRNVEVPKENLVGELHGGAFCFNQMMIPERLTSAAGCLGVWGALDLAVRYSNRRRAFGREIRNYQAINFIVADSITQLDAARSLTYMAARAADANALNVRRIVSEAKRFATESAWDVVNNAMQVMGGIGYTDVYPIERFLRDIRLSLIWTGTSQIMNLLIQHEYYKEVLSETYDRRKMEQDAMSPEESERCFTDEDMWRIHETGPTDAEGTS